MSSVTIFYAVVVATVGGGDGGRFDVVSSCCHVQCKM